MTALSWSVTARRDVDWIAARLIEIDPVLAYKVVVAIRAGGRRLEDYPLSAPRLGDTETRKLIVREVPYLLFYRVHGGKIEIMRVRHAHEDWRPH